MAVELAEPDLIVNVAGQKHGVAIKRIKSRKQVLANAKKGSKQIDWSATERGLVFLDVSNLMNRNMEAIRYLQDLGAEIGGTVHGHLMRFASEEGAAPLDLNQLRS